MRWRRAEPADFAEIHGIWERAHYGFEFPDLADQHVLSSWVAIEDGRIVAWAGARAMPEILSVMEPGWGSPHYREKLFATLHRPVAEDVAAAGFARGFATLDPRYPLFARCLLRLGWRRGWDTFWITTRNILGK